MAWLNAALGLGIIKDWMFLDRQIDMVLVKKII